MPFSFTCPHCGLQIEVADRHVGQSGPCVGCGKRIVIAAPDPASEAAIERPRKAARPTIAVLVLLVVGAMFGCLLLGAMFLAFLMPSVPTNRWRLRPTICENNLQRIGLAMMKYHDAHGQFPPAYVADENGKPMHSWRVLLLPYLDEVDLYSQYDFSQPWNGPVNLRLVNQMPSVFHCPEDSKAAPGETSYMVVVGPGTLLDAAKQAPAEDVPDGPANTILVVESVEGGVCWLAPTDVGLRQLSLGVNAAQKGGIRSGHVAGGATVLMADGTVHELPDHIRPEVLRALATPNGAEGITTAQALDGPP